MVEELVPVVLVIIILVAWIVILGPSLIKRRARRGGDQSISHFHYQLRVLEHAAPEPIVTPAYRLRAVDGTGSPTGITYPSNGAPPVLTVVGAKELPRPALAFLGDPEPSATGTASMPARSGSATVSAQMADRDSDEYDDIYEDAYADEYEDAHYRSASVRHGGPDPLARGVDAFARHQARRRRRDILVVLAGVFAATCLIGLITGAPFVWMLCVVDGLALSGYVALLVYLKRMAMERESKLHYLDPFADGRPVRTGSTPTYASGRYAHPSNGHAAAR